MTAATHSRTIASFVETGRVIDVDVENYTIAVTTQFTQKPQYGISFASPYQDLHGAGIYFMPEVGSLVWLCFPSDGSRPFVIGWASPREESGSFKANKKDLNPGDIYLGTRDENFIYLRRGGVVQIGGGPICQRIFLPVNNTIKDFCENYGLMTVGGSLEWTVSRTEKDVNGHRPAMLRLSARQFADDANPIAYLEIGSHDDDSQNILSLVINESGEDGAATKISLDVKKNGDVTWVIENDYTIKAKNFSVLATEEAKIEGTEKATLRGGIVALESTTGNVAISSAGGIAMSAAPGAEAAIGPTARVGNGTIPVMLAPPDWVTWLLNHTHPIPSPGAPATSAPSPTYIGDPTATAIFGK